MKKAHQVIVVLSIIFLTSGSIYFAEKIYDHYKHSAEQKKEDKFLKQFLGVKS